MHQMNPMMYAQISKVAQLLLILIMIAHIVED